MLTFKRQDFPGPWTFLSIGFIIHSLQWACRPWIIILTSRGHDIASLTRIVNNIWTHIVYIILLTQQGLMTHICVSTLGYRNQATAWIYANILEIGTLGTSVKFESNTTRSIKLIYKMPSALQNGSHFVSPKCAKVARTIIPACKWQAICLYQNCSIRRNA